MNWTALEDFWRDELSRAHERIHSFETFLLAVDAGLIRFLVVVVENQTRTEISQLNVHIVGEKNILWLETKR